MNKYHIINNLPFGFDFSNRNRKELREYSEWFFQNKRIRIAELCSAVDSFIGKTWNNDFSVRSFDELNYFLLSNIESKPLSEEELIVKRNNIPSYIDVETWDLTIKSRSLLIDIGIYWGEVIIKNHSQLHWEQYFPRNKKSIDYGHMVIMLGNNPPINPVWLMYIQGLKVIGGESSQDLLNRLYSIWTCSI
jgi:hypothetical protein